MTVRTGGADAPRTLPPAVLTGCVRSATAAPSLHNSQPWLFRVTGDGVDVYADPRRRLEGLDPAGRELFISVGAAVFTLRLAIRREGFLTRCALFPDPDDADLVARVTVGRPAVPSPAVEALADAIARRHSNRGPFTEDPVPATTLELLRDAAHREGAVLTVADAATRDAIVALSHAADRSLRARGGYRAEKSRSVRHPRRDGMPFSPVGPWDALEAVPTRDFGLLPEQPPETGAFEPYPTILVLSTPGDDRAHWVIAGQALQRVLLAATWQNLATTPASQPVEVPAVRRRLTDGARGLWAQMVIRIGYGRPAAATARRDLSEVLLPD
ncbi:Acg family FMN-binding oxidoreductase [Actinoplanes sp. NPDC049316]|uniref:Acg family FMN-binding oxidoreductase n=1 Tax=Actinoplanes sp. NPDC049316 TaxID=3154727 RepID=UPI00343749F1